MAWSISPNLSISQSLSLSVSLSLSLANPLLLTRAITCVLINFISDANRLPMSDPWTNLLIHYSGTHKQITSIFHIDYLMSARASVGDNRYICTWLAVMMLVLYPIRHVVLTLCALNCLAGALTCISDYIHYKVGDEITHRFPNFNGG